MKLYELQKEEKILEELYLMSIDEDTGEIIDHEVIKELELELQNQLVSKSTGLIKFIKNSESSLEILIAERKRLQLLEKNSIKKLENFRNYIKYNMKAMGVSLIETSLGKLSLRSSTSVELNEELIDSKYGLIVESIKFSKTNIGSLLKSGINITGARLVTNHNLYIK